MITLDSKFHVFFGNVTLSGIFASTMFSEKCIPRATCSVQLKDEDPRYQPCCRRNQTE